MTVRRLFAAFALLVVPAAVVASPPTGSETTTSSVTTTTRTAQTQRKIERTRPGAPLKPRMIEAPGAAVMMIPASYDPAQNGPFGPL